MTNTIATISHSGHTSQADHIADHDDDGRRLFSCFACGQLVDEADCSVLISCDDCSPRHAVLPGADLDEALSLELVRQSECECDASSHWAETDTGERRIECSCSCTACGEY